MNAIRRKEKKLPKKMFFVFKGAIIGIFQHSKTFIQQNVLLFCCYIHEKCFWTVRWFLILKNNMLSREVCQNCKAFKYGLKKENNVLLVKKTFFSSQIRSEKIQKKKFH